MTYAPVVSHCDELLDALGPFRRSAAVAGRWGERLAAALCGGGRLLAAGNGGSAAQAQHLTAELVGRYRTDRPPFSAIALHADTSSTTAIANDYGVDELFSRQVRAHGRPGDVLILLSTSGASANLLSAADAGRAAGLHVWALTGPAPNPLAAAADEAFCVDAPSTATVQELHLVAVHMICAAFDDTLEADGLLAADPPTTHGTGIARSLSAHTDGAARDVSRSARGAQPPPSGRADGRADGAPQFGPAVAEPAVGGPAGGGPVAAGPGAAGPAGAGAGGAPAGASHGTASPPAPARPRDGRPAAPDGTRTASGPRPARDGAHRLDGVRPVAPDGAVGDALGRRGGALRPEEATGRDGVPADGRPARRTTAFDGASRPGADGTPRSGADGTPRSGTDGASRSGADGVLRPGADGTPRSGADGASRSGADGASRSAFDGASRSGADGASRSGADGTPRSGADGVLRPGADGTPRPGADGVLRPGNGGVGRAQAGGGREGAGLRGGTGRHRAVPGRGAGRKGPRDE